MAAFSRTHAGLSRVQHRAVLHLPRRHAAGDVLRRHDAAAASRACCCAAAAESARSGRCTPSTHSARSSAWRSRRSCCCRCSGSSGCSSAARRSTSLLGRPLLLRAAGRRRRSRRAALVAAPVAAAALVAVDRRCRDRLRSLGAHERRVSATARSRAGQHRTCRSIADGRTATVSVRRIVSSTRPLARDERQARRVARAGVVPPAGDAGAVHARRIHADAAAARSRSRMRRRARRRR